MVLRLAYGQKSAVCEIPLTFGKEGKNLYTIFENEVIQKSENVG
jgi:hypothetical protein